MINASIRGLRVAFRLIRPGNVAMIFCAAMVGAILGSAGGGVDSVLASPVILAAVSIALLGAGANIMNDIIDVEIDRVNRPDRPLVSGRFSMWAARVFSGVMLAGGLAIPMWISGTHTRVAFLVTAYNLKLKQVPLLGNISIGILTAFALLFGSLSVHVNSFVLAAMVFAFLTTLAREIVKDMEDVIGDASADVRTLPLSSGILSARYLSVTIVCLTIVLTPIPFLVLDFSGLYLLTVLLANAVLLRTLMLLFAEQIDAGAVSGTLKWAMVLGMIALLTAGSPPG